MGKREKMVAVFLACLIPVSSVLAFDKVINAKSELNINGQYDNDVEVYPVEGIEDGEEVPPELLEVKPADNNETNRFIVKYKDGSDAVDSNMLEADLSGTYDIKDVKEYSVRSTKGFWFFSSEREEKMHVVEINEKVDIKKFVDEVESEFNVEYVQPDYKINLSAYADPIQTVDDSAVVDTEGRDISSAEEEDVNKDTLKENAAEGTEDNIVSEDSINNEENRELREDKIDTEQTNEEAGSNSDISSDPDPSAAEETVDPSETESLSDAAEQLKTEGPAEDNSLTATELPETYESDETAIVALIDTGVDIANEALLNKIYNNSAEQGNDEDNNGFIGDVSGWDFYNDTPEVYNTALGLDQAHGTHIAGIIAETAPNVQILPLKVFENGIAYTSDIIEAIQYAERMGAEIVNCSWGCTEENPALKDAMENSNMTFVCAVGNNRLDLKETPIYPACYDLDNIVSVTSVNEDGGLSYFSNYGMADIAALGRDVESCFPEGDTGTLTGTSISAGFVSGALAAVYTNNNETIARLYDTSDKLLNLQDYVEGGRRLDLDNLISNIKSDEIIDVSPSEDFNTEGYSRTPAQSWELFSSLDNIAVEAGQNFLVVLKADGSVWTWGKNASGELGLGHFNAVYTPQQVPSISNVVEIAAGQSHVVVRTAQNYAYTWGGNYHGCLGIGSGAISNVPMRMINGTNVTGIGAGSDDTYILKNGSVYTCGNNGWGAIGDGTTIDRNTLTDIGLSEIKKITGNEGATFAVSDTGALYSWGHDGHGRLGDGGADTNRGTPQVIIESGIADVSMGYFDCMALAEDGTVYNWGNGYGGSPVKRDDISGVTKITAARQAEFVMQGNTVKARGMNANGVLGVGDTVWHDYWTAVTGEFVDFDVYEFWGIAIGTNGCIYTWGVIDADTGEYITAPEKMSGEINSFGGNSFAEAEEVGEGLTHGNLISTSDKDYYKFVPDQDGIYSIYSISENKDIACKIYVLSSTGSYSLKFSNDDASGIMSENKRDFYLSKPLKAGTEYYIYIYPYGSKYEGEYELHIEREQSNSSYKFYSAVNASNDVYINVNNISSFANRTFTVTYDPSKLSLADACIFTQTAETAAGAVPGSNITIISVSEGELVFKITQTIPSGRKLSGTVNVIRFTSLASGYKTVSYEIKDTTS